MPVKGEGRIDEGCNDGPRRRREEGTGGRRGINRKRESCNLYIKASIERVSAAPSYQSERKGYRQRNQRIHIFIASVCAATCDNSRKVFSKSRSTYPACPLYSRKLTNARRAYS